MISTAMKVTPAMFSVVKHTLGNPVQQMMSRVDASAHRYPFVGLSRMFLFPVQIVPR